MKLEKYIEQQASAKGISKSAMVNILAKLSKVSRATIYNVLNGARITSYGKVLDLSNATQGAVTHKDIARR